MTNDTQSQTQTRTCAACGQPITGPYTRVLTADYTAEGYVASLEWQDYCLSACKPPTHAACSCESCDAIPRKLMLELVAAVESDLGDAIPDYAIGSRGRFAYAVGYATMMLGQAKVAAELDAAVPLSWPRQRRLDGSPRS